MPLQPIPTAWLKAVSRILKSGTSREIRSTQTYAQKFQFSFPAEGLDSVIQYFLLFLEGSNPVGCPVDDMERPPGEAWEFWFIYKGHKTYGKILLTEDRKRIILHSAHLPEKEYLRCESRRNEQ